MNQFRRVIRKLKSTGEIVHLLPWGGQLGMEPWSSKHDRFLIPNPNGKPRIQIINKRNIRKEIIGFAPR